MINPINKTIEEKLNCLLEKIEEKFNSDFININGPIQHGLDYLILQIVEELAKYEQKKNRLLVMITTYGGDAQVVERLVNIFRHHYEEVDFIVPDYAYSAGTILCMSGDNIYMDYYSALGPIDPQVLSKEGKWVPALGYLDKINELIVKAKNGELTEAEFHILSQFDLAEVRGFEQAKELTIDLLNEWLVKYKFKNWDKHSSSGDDVTEEDKREKANQIANELNDYNRWKSHGRPINMSSLIDLGLKIEDFGKDNDAKQLIRDYYDTMSDYSQKNGLSGFLHSRYFI